MNHDQNYYTINTAIMLAAKHNKIEDDMNLFNRYKYVAEYPKHPKLTDAERTGMMVVAIYDRKGLFIATL